MALPYLIKYVYNNGSDDNIRRGKKIHAQGNIETIEYNDLMYSVTFRVKDDGFSNYYKVYITHFKEAASIKLKCTCPVDQNDLCRHKAASLFMLQDMLDRKVLKGTGLQYEQRHTVLKLKTLDAKAIRALCSSQSFSDADDFMADGGKAKIVSAKDERVVAELRYGGASYKLLVQKNEERNFDTSCNCNSETENPVCVHKAILFLQLIKEKGPNYFDSIRNWDAVKNKLLGMYGYKLTDNLKGKFEFTYTDGKPFLRVLDPTIQKVAAPPPGTAPAAPPKTFQPLPFQPVEENVETKAAEKKAELKLGLAVVQEPSQYPYIFLEAFKGAANADMTGFEGDAEWLDLNKYIDLDLYSEEDKEIIAQVRKTLWTEVRKYMDRNSPFDTAWESTETSDENAPQPDNHVLIDEYLHPKFARLFEELSDDRFLFRLPAGKDLSFPNLIEAHFSTQCLVPRIHLSKVGDTYNVECKVKVGLMEKSLADAGGYAPMFFKQGDTFHTWQHFEDVAVAHKFMPKGLLEISEQDWPQALQELVVPLGQGYHVEFGNLPKEEIKGVKPTCKVFLREKGDFLIMEPVFSYDGHEIGNTDKDKILVAFDNSLILVNRDKVEESNILQRIEGLHSNFIKPDDNTRSLALKGMDVLKNNWFFLFIDAVKEMGLTVFGFDSLRNFRFNTAKPSTRIYISSNTDWFDAKIEISFGKEMVTVDDIKMALAKKQQYVQLKDGSLGILPEDWIKRYSLLFRVGEGRNTNIKISRYHISVIEELYNKRNDEELVFQLEERYDNLRQKQSIKEIPPPEHLEATLRPYQVSGFRWLNYLREVNWGGILADDMGLGKTVQALTYLCYLKETEGALKALVVCPTTLMYNWQNEIRKFTPGLKMYVHHGGGRLRDSINQDGVDVIITTYGTLRSDIKQFVEPLFDYVVLDESQAIKNPGSKVAKSACLIRAKNRLCLSGTPLQNNTFDIYAQMNFLNPGMLGSVDFFKQEFAVPIDKLGEKEQKEHLRRLLYPFILRRTKEQVASDLPPKTEMVLYCEMEEEQRRIYDAFRNDFRDKILGLVDTQGVGRSQLTILQGLMKLRQICDSPYIMNEKDRYPNVSVKLEEIGREITENIGGHKALVFSQFLGMLALIKAKLRELEVPFEYFDGSTTATDREKAIQNFQNNDDCRVFLISLKAGGVGLNLTAADYVYIVDPWWNPAVEQQAIDRTHRIGQTKNVFAYRMICTDTVEDKILKLQDRKKALAKDLITDDEGFVKNLSREDLEYLFS